MKTNTPMATMPSNCTQMLPSPKMLAASVPQTPAKQVRRDGSDHVVHPEFFQQLHGGRADDAPDCADQDRPVVPDQSRGPAVIETKPAMAPFKPTSSSTRPRSGRDMAMAAMDAGPRRLGSC